jgi:hypothetical protein
MGLEFISQPQVFTQRLTALGGIEGYVPPLWSTFYTWTSTIPTTANQLPLDGTNALTDYSGSYIVTVGGVLQSPTTYNIDVINRSIIFSNIINEDTDVVITQIGTIGLTSLGFQELSAVDATFDSLTANEIFVSNLTALSSVLHITDITTYEVSGFDVQGSINVQDDVTVGNTLYAYYLSADDASITNLSTNTITTNTLSSNVTFIDTLDVNTSTVNTLSADTAHITSPILSTHNSTQIATTNFVRLFGGFQNTAVYTSGTGTVDLSSLGEGIEKIKVTVIGGGGAGGGSGAAAGAAGSGGGGGGTAISYITNIPAGTTFQYTVGVGGTAGTAGANNGNNGSTSTFTISSLSISLSGNGGVGGIGVGTIANTGRQGGAGGTAVGGQINFTGSVGGTSISTALATNAVGGIGGTSILGVGAGEGRTAATGNGFNAVNNTGAGGGGGIGATAASGGTGGSGIIFVEW